MNIIIQARIMCAFAALFPDGPCSPMPNPSGYLPHLQEEGAATVRRLIA